MRLHALIALLVAAGAGCGEATTPTPDAGRSTTPTGDAGAAGPADPVWTIETIDDANAGFQPDLQRAPDGTLGLAYYRRAASTGVCGRVMGSPPILEWDVMYAEDRGSGFAPAEVVTTVQLLAPPGLSLAFDPDSRPAVSFVGGAEAVRVCGASNLMLARRGASGWQASSIAANGAATPVFEEDRAQCASGQNYCNVGDVVGEWSAMTFVNEQPLVVFRDVHFAFTQDDWLRSDLELFEGGVQTLDAGWGGGTYARMVMHGDRLVVAHHNPHPTTYGGGVWVLSRQGTTWSRTRVVEVDTIGYRLGLASNGDRLALVYHDEDDQKLIYYDSQDGEQWSREVVDQTGNTGFSPWLVFDSNGDSAVSYHHCGRYDPNRTDCAPDGDSLRFAVRRAGRWRSIEVEPATERAGVDGAYTALVFDRSGDPVIAYQATFADPITLETVRELRVARGRTP